MFGPVGSPYPGTPIALAFLGLLAAVFVRSKLSASSRIRAAVGQRDWAFVLVIVMAALFILVVLWTMWTHR